MSKNRGGSCIFLHLNFSSRVPREVTDKAWMNSENSMRPSYRVKKGREETAQRPDEHLTSHLLYLYFQELLLFFHDALAVFWKRGQTVAPSQLLFLPCTWLSPGAKICHLWSLGRWMWLAHSLKVTALKQPLCIWGEDVSHFFTDSILWMDMANNSVWQGRKYSTLTLNFLLALLESHAMNLITEAQHFQLPSSNCGLQRSSVRPHFVQRRETSANMDNNQA